MTYEKWYNINKEKVEKTFQEYTKEKNEENEKKWLNAVEDYKEICLIVLEKLIQENQDVLKRLKEI